jgi:hypothetical protein
MTGREPRAGGDDAGDLIGIERHFHREARSSGEPHSVNSLGVDRKTFADIGHMAFPAARLTSLGPLRELFDPATM